MRHSFTPREIRRLLDESVHTSAALDAFFIDHFPDVARQLTPGMTRIERVNLLLQMEPDLLRIASCLAAREQKAGRPLRAVRRYGLPGLVLFVAAAGLCTYLFLKRPRPSAQTAAPVPPPAAVAAPVPPPAAVASPVPPPAVFAGPVAAPSRPSPPRPEPKRREPLGSAPSAPSAPRPALSAAPAGINRDNVIVDSPGASMHNRSPVRDPGAVLNSGNRIENSPGAQMTNEVTTP